MLEKLLRAPLPEQIVALLEKLEQDPDTSHLEKVDKLLDYHATTLSVYEEWVIRRATRKVRNVIRRAQTLNNVMSIVINDRSDDEQELFAREKANQVRAKMYASLNGGPISGTLAQHAAAQQAHIDAHRAQMNIYADQLRNTYLTGSSQ